MKKSELTDVHLNQKLIQKDHEQKNHPIKLLRGNSRSKIQQHVRIRQKRDLKNRRRELSYKILLSNHYEFNLYESLKPHFGSRKLNSANVISG